MTREGFQKLEQELRDMRGPQLREHIQNLSEAKDKGDLSENAEYDAHIQDVRSMFGYGMIIL